MIFENKSFSDLIINKISEIFLFNYKSIFKISKLEYLLVNPMNEFKKKFENKNNDLINILLNEDLNKIQIYIQDNNIFIYLYKNIGNTNLNHLEIFESQKFSRESDSINIRHRSITYSYEDISYRD